MPVQDTVVDICNEALSACNQKFILSLNDASNLARNCKFWYDKCRRELLEQCDWTFARKVVDLNLIGELPGFEDFPDWASTTNASESNNITDDNAVFPWAFIYSYPIKCRFIHKVYSLVNNMAFGEGWTAGYDSPGYRFPGLRDMNTWEILRSKKTNELAIATNIRDAIGKYTFDMEDTSQFSQLFCTALSLKLASRICMSVTGDKELKNDIDNDLKDIMTDAFRLNLSEYPEFGPRSSSYEDERNRG